jgi:DNA polymerase III sliding clamp (beta) subunit (PCNA family)
MNREELVKKLGMVSQALAKDDLIPIFKCFAFTEENVMACNDTLAITSPCVTEQAFCVHGETLKGLLENSHSEIMEFSINDDDLIIKAGKSVFKLPWFPIEDFLWLIPSAEPKAQFNLDADFITGLEACLLTTGTDTARAALMGVQFTNGTMYSTDGDALTRFVTNAKVKHTFMLPNNFCNALIKVTKESEASKGKVVIDDDWACVALDSGYYVYGRLMVNDTPTDHEGLIKRTMKAKPEYVKIPGSLHHALSRARVVADAESAKTVFTVEAGRLKLLTTASMGVINDALPFTGHSDVQANVSAERIQRCISLCDEMSVAENCCTFRSGSKLFILSGNLGG